MSFLGFSLNRGIGGASVVAFLLAIGSLLSAAQFNELSDACKGQYLYYKSSGRLLQFEKLGKSGQWECIVLDTGKTKDVAANELEILPLYADSDDFDIIAFAAGYALPGSTNPQQERMLDLYKQLLAHRGSARGDAFRACLLSIDAICTVIARNISALRADGVSAATGVVDTLVESNAQKQIQAMAANSDFLLAIACYLRYRSKVLATIGTALPSHYMADVHTILNDLCKEILDAYANTRVAIAVRNSNFSELFPMMRGGWNRGTPTSVSDLSQLASSAFTSFQKTLEYSEHTEFPQWGAAMLEVLQLVPEDSLAPEKAALFDDCMRKYKEKFQLGL